jgi:Phage DNA packaging protein Nu1
MNLIGNVNKRAAAEFFAVTYQTLDRWFMAGCPVVKRGAGDAIVELDLSAMTRWRIGRAHELKEKSSSNRDTKKSEPLVERLQAIVKNFAGEILVPCLVNDFRADAKRIAKFAGVSEEQAIQVWSIWAIANYDSLQRLFEDPDFAIRHTEYTQREMKAAGERASKRNRKN